MRILEVPYHSDAAEKSDFESNTFYLSDADRKPDEKLTEGQIQEIRAELEKELSQEKVDEFISALSKFGKAPDVNGEVII